MTLWLQPLEFCCSVLSADAVAGLCCFDQRRAAAFGLFVSVPSAKAVLGLKISCTAFAIFHNGLASLATFALGDQERGKTVAQPVLGKEGGGGTSKDWSAVVLYVAEGGFRVRIYRGLGFGVFATAFGLFKRIKTSPNAKASGLT